MPHVSRYQYRLRIIEAVGGVDNSSQGNEKHKLKDVKTHFERPNAFFLQINSKEQTVL